VPDSLADFERQSFEHDGQSRTVFRKGTGPGVVVMTEIPGITPEVAGLARLIEAEGLTVAMPDLIGTAGKDFSQAYAMRSMARACISREFNMLSAGKRSPITDWLRALARSLHAECGGPGVGAIGMCLTGNFALSLMLDDEMIAPILSQPSLPLGLTGKQRRAVHLGDDELEVVKGRVRSEGLRVLGMRFTADPLCPKERFDRLREELGDGFEAIEIDSSKGNPNRLPRTAHSVVTADLIDEAGHPTVEARERVLEFLRERLL
jgi:dienelactone hydrolase